MSTKGIIIYLGLLSANLLFANPSDYQKNDKSIFEQVNSWNISTQKQALQLLEHNKITLSEEARRQLAYHHFFGDKLDAFKMLTLAKVPPIQQAQVTPFYMYQPIIEQNQNKTENDLFTREFRELQNRKILAHVLGIEGDSHLKGFRFRLAGSNVPLMLQTFIGSLPSRSGDTNLPERIYSTLEKIKAITALFDTTSQFYTNKEFATASGSKVHAYSLYYNPHKKILALGNSGIRPGHIPAGILIFSTANIACSDWQSFIEFIKNKTSSKNFFDELYSKAETIFGEPIYIIKRAQQRVGNCAWMAFDHLLFTILVADQLSKNEVEFTENWDHALLEMTDYYKEINLFIKKHIIQAYLRSDTQLQSPDLIKSCYFYAAGGLSTKLLDWQFRKTLRPGEIHFPIGSQILDEEILLEAKEKLIKFGYPVPGIGFLNSSSKALVDYAFIITGKVLTAIITTRCLLFISQKILSFRRM